MGTKTGEDPAARALAGALDKTYAALERPPSNSYSEAQREWYWNEICMGGCDHYRPDCLESDRLTECMRNMSHALRLEMNQAVPRFRSRQEYEDERADVMHASGEEGPNGR